MKQIFPSDHLLFTLEVLGRHSNRRAWMGLTDNWQMAKNISDNWQIAEKNNNWQLTFLLYWQLTIGFTER